MSSFNSEVLRSRVSINNSLSKQMNSFYHSPRFTWKEKGSYCFYYNLPSVRSSRAASICRSKKTEFDKRSPYSNGKLYNSHDINATMNKSPSYSFGIGRDQCKQYPLLGIGIHPEPATYTIKSLIGNEALKYSIRKRIQHRGFSNSPCASSNTNTGPGPGTYDCISLNPKGYYPISNITNSLHMPFSLIKEERFKRKLGDISPSPASYNVNSTSFNGTGVFALSQYNSNFAKTMGKKTIKEYNSRVIRKSPCPGDYAHFSSFSGFHY